MGSQVKAGGEQAQQASRAVRTAVIKEAEVVVCTLSSSGGELLTILAAGPLFDAVIIDEVTIGRPSHSWNSSPRVSKGAQVGLWK